MPNLPNKHFSTPLDS